MACQTRPQAACALGPDRDARAGRRRSVVRGLLAAHLRNRTINHGATAEPERVERLIPESRPLARRLVAVSPKCPLRAETPRPARRSPTAGLLAPSAANPGASG